MIYILVALDDGAGAVVLFLISNPGSVIVVLSYSAYDKGVGAVVVVSAVVYVSDAVFSIVVIDKGAVVVVVAVTVTVASWSPIVVIVLSVRAGAVIVYFVVVLFNIVEI